MYKIILENRETVWFNERVIMEIRPIKDRLGLYILTHFSGGDVIIRGFIKI